MPEHRIHELDATGGTFQEGGSSPERKKEICLLDRDCKPSSETNAERREETRGAGDNLGRGTITHGPLAV